MATRLGNINLFVRDVARSADFYTDVLGLEFNHERSHPPSFALLEAGSCTITLQDANTPGASFGASDSVELGFIVDDLETIRELLQQWGMDVDPIQHMGWGSGIDLRDEDGHRLTLYIMRD